MGCKTESKQIGEHEYSVTQWPADKAMVMKFKLIKTIGPALFKIAGGFSQKKDAEGNDIVPPGGHEADPFNVDINTDSISEGLSQLFKENDPEELAALFKNCVVGAGCDGTIITEQSFNMLFSGDSLVDVYRVFLFVVQVNFSNLLKGKLLTKVLDKL